MCRFYRADSIVHSWIISTILYSGGKSRYDIKSVCIVCIVQYIPVQREIDVIKEGSQKSCAESHVCIVSYICMCVYIWGVSTYVCMYVRYPSLTVS